MRTNCNIYKGQFNERFQQAQIAWFKSVYFRSVFICRNKCLKNASIDAKIFGYQFLHDKNAELPLWKVAINANMQFSQCGISNTSIHISKIWSSDWYYVVHTLLIYKFVNLNHISIRDLSDFLKLSNLLEKEPFLHENMEINLVYCFVIPPSTKQPTGSISLQATNAFCSIQRCIHFGLIR